MQKFKYISASIFLGIFTMLLMHQALPHDHLEHKLMDDTKASTHHHSHEHEEEKKDHNNISGILDFLFGSHSHTYHSNDFHVKKEARTYNQLKKDLSFILPEFQILSTQHPHNRVMSFPPLMVVYQHPGLSTPTLRGPPTLG